MVAACLIVTGSARAAEDRILWYSINDGLTNTTTIQNAINFCVANNFNAICFLARYRANAYYKTNRDFATYSNPEPEVSATDGLQYLIDHGHEAGLRIYISFSCFLVTSTSTYPAFMPSGSVTWKYSSASSDLTYAPTLPEYPRAMTTSDDSEGLWADVGRADLRTYTINVMKDIVQNYDVDGVILDRVRYRGDSIPHNTQAYGYNPTALSEMVSLGEIPNTTPAPGATAFITARRNAVSRFITDAGNAVHAMKPWVIMGSAPVIYGFSLTSTYYGVFQHFPTWNSATNTGHVSGFGNMDFIAPQYYRSTDTDNANLMNLVNTDIDEVNRMFHQGTFGIYLPYAAADFAQSICDLRQKGAKGFGTFAYNATSAAGYISSVNAVNTSPCGTNVIATPTPAADFTNKLGWDTLPPNPVTGASVTGGFRTATLNWTPPTPATDGDTAVRYLIYRGTSPVKLYYANQAGRTTAITGNSFIDAGAPAGTWYYKIVSVDDYNNKTAVQVGPTVVSGLDIYIESRLSVANGSGTTAAPAYVETSTFTGGSAGNTTAKSSASGLVGAGSRVSIVPGQTAAFKPNITQAGAYNVYITLDDNATNSNADANANYVVTNTGADRTGSVYLDPVLGPSDMINDWHLLEADVLLPLGQTKGITLTNVDGNNNTGKRFVIDAVRFELETITTSVDDWSMY